MVILHTLSEWINGNIALSNSFPNYWYEGYCPQSGKLLRLPRTPLAEAIACSLMRYLATHEPYTGEGKMYGILLVELPNGERRVLKAFSGLLQGQSRVAGWVPPIPGREQLILAETLTLEKLEAIKQELIALKQLPERQHYETQVTEFTQRLQEMSDRHILRKQQRHIKRQHLYQTLAGEALTLALEELDAESRLDGIERRQLKRQRDAMLQPLQQFVEQADRRMHQLKQQRKALSRQLQTQMHATYSLTNFSGKSASLQALGLGTGLPTGTGECCAPKLLHYAATQKLKPLAMAEFWWGSPSANQDKVQGQFYGACVERCQPLMGFLLSGLSQDEGSAESDSLEQILPILYEDEWLIAVNKPPGLLSVPGRYRDRQDSVLSRLCHLLPDGMGLTAVHRLDQETSGILLLARDPQTHRQLSQQFQQRQVEKVYEAVLSGLLRCKQGAIALPLWGDPQNRPYQIVHEERGKPSETRFQVMEMTNNTTRVELIPLTGRTHQLRVHAADSRGLGIPILGDRLYGCQAIAHRLHLHARELRIVHPQLKTTLQLQVKTPF